MTYSCKNRPPFPETTEMVDGWENAWLRRKVQVPFRMSRVCEYSRDYLGQKDQGCTGCSWRAEREEE